MAGHAMADHRAVKDIESGEQRGRAVPGIIVGHRPGPPLLQRQARLGAVEDLNLRLLVDRRARDCGPAGRDVTRPRRATWRPNAGSCNSLKRRTRYGCRRCAAQIRCIERSDTSSRGHCPAGPMRRRATRLTESQFDDAVDQRWRQRCRPGLVLSRSRPAIPSRMNHSCPRHTQASRPRRGA